MCHTIGGIVVAGAFVYYVLYRGKYPKKKSVFLFVLMGGILWELYELYTGFMHISDPGYYIDTAKDLCFDVFGAWIMYSMIKNKFYGR